VTQEDSELSSQSLPPVLPSDEAPANVVVQHLEPVGGGGDDDDAVATGDSKSRPQSGVKRGLSGSTSMESLLSLSDLDAGIEIPASPTKLAAGEPQDGSGFTRQKVRQSACTSHKGTSVEVGGLVDNSEGSIRYPCTVGSQLSNLLGPRSGGQKEITQICMY